MGQAGEADRFADVGRLEPLREPCPDVGRQVRRDALLGGQRIRDDLDEPLSRVEGGGRNWRRMVLRQRGNPEGFRAVYAYRVVIEVILSAPRRLFGTTVA